MEQKESYNDAVRRLRAIVEEVEVGKLDVDLLLEKVQEAARLIKLCKDRLFLLDEEVKKALGEL